MSSYNVSSNASWCNGRSPTSRRRSRCCKGSTSSRNSLVGEGVRRGITLGLVVGFFVTLVLAWYHGERGAQRVTGTELLIIGLVLALGGGFLWRFAAVRSADSKTATVPNESRSVINAKSIAVLPFENRSHDPDNAYFADGIQDEILTRLAKIADLKVISRTSTQHYKSAPENLPEIARQLGVAHIVEGSVQK